MVDPKNLDAIDEELVAYLDGELPAERNEAIERRLMEDQEYRIRLKSLEKTWDILDQLPKSEPTNSFTKSTMELVVSSIQKQERRKARNSWTWWLAFVVAPLIVGTSAYFYSRHLRLLPYRELVEDFQVIENLDHYRKVDNNIEFLEKLANEPFFADSETTGAQTLPVRNNDFQQAEQTLSQMSYSQLSEVKNKQEQFDRLDESEKQLYRTFDRELDQHPDSVRLRRVMLRFYEWLKTLNSLQQIELLVAQTADQKIEKYRGLRSDQDSQVDGLPESDFQTFENWIKELADTKAAVIRVQIENLQLRGDRERRDRLRDTLLQDNESIVRAYLRFFPRPELVPDSAIEDLKSRLSTKAQKLMGGTKDEQIIFIRQMLTRPQISEDKLRDFYFSDLKPEERKELDQLSPEVMKDRLRRIYLERKLLIMPPVRR